MARSPRVNLDYSQLAVSDTEAPPTRARQQYENHALTPHVVSSYETDTWKSITVPGAAVGSTRSVLNAVAAAQGMGIKVRPLGDEYDKEAESVTVSFLAKDRKGRGVDQEVEGDLEDF